MFIKDLKRFNIYAEFEAPDGSVHAGLLTPEIRAQYGVTEIIDPIRESTDTHYVSEIDDPPYVVNTPKPADVVLELFKEKKREEIRSAYETMDCDNYTDANLVVWAGGEISATRLYSKYNLEKERGGTDAVFYDVNGDPHILLLPDALSVCVGIAGNSSACFDKKQLLMTQINNATTLEELTLINW